MRSHSRSTSMFHSQSRARCDRDDSQSRHGSYSPPRCTNHSRSWCGTRHSRSQSRTPSKTVRSQPRSKNWNWEEIPDTPDYSEHINFDGSDTEAQEGVSKLVEVSRDGVSPNGEMY